MMTGVLPANVLATLNMLDIVFKSRPMLACGRRNSIEKFSLRVLGTPHPSL